MQNKKTTSRITFWGTLLVIIKDALNLCKQMKLSPYWQARLHEYALLMRVDKPIGTLLLLWPTYWALWLASDGFPPVSLFVIFTLGVFLTRSAGCVINDFADRNLDGCVERTKSRPLVSGRVNNSEALLLFVVLALTAFLLVLFLNRLTMILSVVAITIATLYPFCKRVTYFPQIILGAAFSMSIPMAYAATLDSIPQTAWLLYIANLLWVLAYDTLYAIVDRKDDLKVGIKSTAILFGDADLQIIALIQGCFIFGMLLVGTSYELNYWYYIGLLGAACLMLWQLHHSKRRDPQNCFEAFLNNQWVGLCIFCGILLAKL